MIDIDNIKKEFSFLEKGQIYLDNAATTQNPNIVLDEIYEYNKAVGNPHSNMHFFADESLKRIEDTRKTVSKFLNCESKNIIFTKSATESLNTAIFGFEDELENGDEILISILEHHANIVPFHKLIEDKKKQGIDIDLKFIYLDENNNLDYDDLKNKLNKNTKILSLTLSSNVTGEDIDFLKVKNILKEKDLDLIVILDAAQVVSHKKVNLKEFEVDALCFSAHKMYGPFGVGVLYLSDRIIEKTKPRIYGGDMILEVTEDYSEYLKDYTKFEGGTPSVDAILGLGKAIEYLEDIGYESIESYLKDITFYAKEELEKIDGIKLYSCSNPKSLISFTIDGIHSHDLATILGSKHICIRAGHHCAMPLHKYFNVAATTRVSFGIYNTKEDVDKLIKGIIAAKEIFGV